MERETATATGERDGETGGLTDRTGGRQKQLESFRSCHKCQWIYGGIWKERPQDMLAQCHP